MKPLVLASQSPRRQELLSRVGVPFVVRPSPTPEPPPAPPPGVHALKSAEAKARAVWREGEAVLGADTVVALGDEVLGKPRDPEENRAFLRRLSGRTHSVYTGAVVITPEGRARYLLSAPRVRFRPLSEAEIAAYVRSGEGLDKAGGYGIQDRGMALVEAVEGDFFAVVGLPVAGVVALLREEGLL